MIKIEEIKAVKATLVRDGVRQPLILHSRISEAELATVEAESGTVTYSIDELEVKTVSFQPKPATVAPAAKPAKPAIVKPVAKAAEPVVESPSQENAPE
jgi:hypothetical protein